jgi:hypothetical protein
VFLNSPLVSERGHQDQSAPGGVRVGGVPGFGALAAAVVHFDAYCFVLGVELDQESGDGIPTVVPTLSARNLGSRRARRAAGSLLVP